MVLPELQLMFRLPVALQSDGFPLSMDPCRDI